MKFKIPQPIKNTLIFLALGGLMGVLFILVVLSVSNWMM